MASKDKLCILCVLQYAENKIFLQHFDKGDPTTQKSHVQQLIWRKTPLHVLILQWNGKTFQIIPPEVDQQCGSHAAGMYSKTWGCFGYI